MHEKLQEIKNVALDEQTNVERADDEMEVSDEEDAPRKKSKIDNNSDEQNNLKEENNNLRCQMEAYKNEVEVVKMELKKEIDDKDKQFKLLQQTLQGMQQQLIEAKRKQTEEENKVKELQNKFKTDSKLKYNIEKDIVNLDDLDETECCVLNEINPDPTILPPSLNDCDARLIGIISAFLNVHPFGAGLDYIWSYVSKLENNLRPSDIELLMSKFPTVFKQELVGIGANIERRWLFNAFNKSNSSNQSIEILELF